MTEIYENSKNYDYYVLDDPKLSDKEYDNLFRKLEKLENEHPSLITQLSPTQRVGHPVSSGFQSYEHSVPMLSLSNAINDEEIIPEEKVIANEKDQSEDLFNEIMKIVLEEEHMCIFKQLS